MSSTLDAATATDRAVTSLAPCRHRGKVIRARQSVTVDSCGTGCGGADSESCIPDCPIPLLCGSEGCCNAGEQCDDEVDSDGDGVADEPCDPCEFMEDTLAITGQHLESGGPCDDCSAEEDRVDVRFGRFNLAETDIQFPSPARVALEVRRFFRSPVRTVKFSNTVGLGWGTNFDERLAGDLTGSPPSNVYWHNPGDRGGMFPTCASGGGGTYACTPMSGLHHSLKRLAGGTWELLRVDGILTKFDATGRLTGKFDRSAGGYGYSVTWDGQGRLSSATDTARHSVVFRLDPTNLGPSSLQLIQQVELVRSPVNQVVATYDYSHGHQSSYRWRGRGAFLQDFVARNYPNDYGEYLAVVCI